MAFTLLFESFGKSIASSTYYLQGSSSINSKVHSKLQVSIFINFSTSWTEPSEIVDPTKYATLPSGGSVQYAASTLVAHSIHNNNNSNNNNNNNKNALNGYLIDLYHILVQPTSHHCSPFGGRMTCAKTTSISIVISIVSSGTTQNKTAKILYT